MSAKSKRQTVSGKVPTADLPFAHATRFQTLQLLIADSFHSSYLLALSGITIAQTTLSPTATIDFEKSHILAMAPALRAGTTIVSPAEHFFISSEAFASFSKNPADTGRQ
jgi:hypothetical protein